MMPMSANTTKKYYFIDTPPNQKIIRFSLKVCWNRNIFSPTKCPPFSHEKVVRMHFDRDNGIMYYILTTILIFSYSHPPYVGGHVGGFPFMGHFVGDKLSLSFCRMFSSVGAGERGGVQNMRNMRNMRKLGFSPAKCHTW